SPVEIPAPDPTTPDAPPAEIPDPGDFVPDLPPLEIPPSESAEKSGVLGRLFGRGDKRAVVRRVLDDDMLESLEELMIASDMGVDTALRITANIAQGRLGKRLSVD